MLTMLCTTELGPVLYQAELGFLFSSPGQSPGRAIVLSPALALVSALAAAAALAKC